MKRMNNKKPILNIVTSSQKVLAIGDSHIRVFEHKFFKLFFKNFTFNITYVPGATAYGIGNEHSKTRAYVLFKESLEKSDYKKIIITLGEVDTAYTLWSIATRDEKSINEVLSLSIQRYQTFLNELICYAPVVVLSAPLPTISDLADCDDAIQGVRKKVNVSQKRRTLLALHFNRKIKNFCETKSNVTFVELSSCVLNHKTKKVSSWFINNKNPCDHHYARWIYALLIIWKIKKKDIQRIFPFAIVR